MISSIPNAFHCFCAFNLVLAAHSAQADTPLGWINSSNESAYTTTAGEFELNVGGMAVNSTIDFLNIRDDLIANNRTLVGDSGDLSGSKIELHYGITSDLSIYYRQVAHSLSIDLGEINSINLIDIDDALETSQQSAGIKWTFFRSDLLNSDNRVSAASIEVSAYSNKSDDFELTLDQLQLGNLEVNFRDPQTFSVADLEDDGWKARLIYSWPLSEIGIGSVWAGFGESEATSGTTSDLSSATFRSFFEQSFELEETYLYFGASLNAQITPRIPLSISYEYINVSDSSFNRSPEVPPAGLPGFLTAANQDEETDNHTLKARISYWLTPRVNVSLTGNLYSNQFLGVLPHYNNPLSGSFSSLPYGFAGVELGYKF